MAAWFRSYRGAWILGPVIWAILALAGWIHARLAGLPVWEVILTWQEWFAALLFLPWLVTLGVPLGRRSGRPPLITTGYLLALVVFALDLLARAILGLGWEPFLLD